MSPRNYREYWLFVLKNMGKIACLKGVRRVYKHFVDDSFTSI
jgi:hypothetical protein